jgi:hypothetical protein
VQIDRAATRTRLQRNTARLVQRLFQKEEGDPRRSYVSQAILYRGTFVIIAMTVWLKHP